MNKKNITLWTLYDFANSLVVIVFAIYFPKWLVIDNGISDFWFNLIFVGSSLLLLLTAPIFSARADRLGQSLPYLRILTFLQFLTILAASLVAVFLPNSATVAVSAAILFMFSNYFYQFSLVIYNALLSQLASRERLEIVSGVGQAGNWLGQVAGLLITLPLASGTLYLAGKSGSVQTFLPAVLLFILLVLPMLFLFKEKIRPKQALIGLVDEYKRAYSSLLSLVRLPSMGVFLLGYFFFNDAMLTVVNNFPLYLEQVFHVSDKVKSILALSILGMAAVGALVGAGLANKVGLKKGLLIILGAWIIIFPIVALIKNFIFFAIVLTIVGLLYGATFAISRAVMSVLTPAEKLNHGFSYYTLAERFSTFVGPLVWGSIVSGLLPLGEWRYRLAVLAMTVFVFIGMLIIRKISLPSQLKEIGQPI